MENIYIIIVVDTDKEGNFDFQVGPPYIRKPEYIIRYENGELNLHELISEYYLGLGFFSSDVSQKLQRHQDDQTHCSFLHLRPIYNINLYFFGVDLSQKEIVSLLSNFSFDTRAVEKIKGGSWPYRSHGLLDLSVEIIVQKTESENLYAKVNKFLSFDFSEYVQSKIVVYVQRGLAKTPNNYRQVASVTLFWKSPSLSQQTRYLLEPQIYKLVKGLIENDQELMRKIRLMTRNFRGGSPYVGDDWLIADWWGDQR